MNTRFNDNKTLENSDVLSSRIAQHSHENNYIDAKQPVFLRWLRMRLRALFERKIWSEVQTWSGSSRTLCKTRALRALQPRGDFTQYALLTYGNMPVQPRFRVKFLLKFKYENVVRLAFQKKFYSKTRMDGHITIREKSVFE